MPLLTSVSYFDDSPNEGYSKINSYGYHMDRRSDLFDCTQNRSKMLVSTVILEEYGQNQLLTRIEYVDSTAITRQYIQTQSGNTNNNEASSTDNVDMSNPNEGSLISN